MNTFSDNTAPETGQQLQRLRQKLGLSRTEFCKRFHIQRRTYVNWEDGDRTPPTYLVPLLEDIVSSIEMKETLAGQIEDLMDSLDEIFPSFAQDREKPEKSSYEGTWYRINERGEYYELSIRRHGAAILQAFARQEDQNFPIYASGQWTEEKGRISIDSIGIPEGDPFLMPDPLYAVINEDGNQLMVFSAGRTAQRRTYYRR